MASQLPGVPNQHITPAFRPRHVHQVVELAFISGFLAWERFIEQSFILYTLGKSTPNGYSPHCYISPRNRKHALRFAKGDKRFPLWNDYDFIVDRSNHFFRNGSPYVSTFRLIRSRLLAMKTIRNAIAHSSTDSQEKFRTLVRGQLQHFPRQFSPGRFLTTLVPNRVPAISYFDQYSDTLSWASERIVPN